MTHRTSSANKHAVRDRETRRLVATITTTADKRAMNRAFTALYQLYWTMVFNLVMMIVKNTAIAEEVAQDTFTLVFKHIRSRFDGRDFKSWISKIAWNRAVNAYRAIRKQGERHTHEMAGENTPSTTFLDAQTAAEISRLREILSRAIEATPMSKAFKRVLVLVDIQGLSYLEAAAEEGCPVGTIMSRLFRARNALREWLHNAPGLKSYLP